MPAGAHTLAFAAVILLIQVKTNLAAAKELLISIYNRSNSVSASSVAVR